MVPVGEEEVGRGEDLVAEAGLVEGVGPGAALPPGEEFALFASSTSGTSITKMWTGFAASYLIAPKWSLAEGQAFAPSISVD